MMFRLSGATETVPKLLGSAPSLYKPLSILLWNSNGLWNHIDLLLQDKYIDKTHLTQPIKFYITELTTTQTDQVYNFNLVFPFVAHFPSDSFQSTSITLVSVSHLPITISAVH